MSDERRTDSVVCPMHSKGRIIPVKRKQSPVTDCEINRGRRTDPRGTPVAWFHVEDRSFSCHVVGEIILRCPSLIEVGLQNRI